jgi:hypothetical protein
MRLWSIHPKYLDAKGLVALWRESLLAKKVIVGGTRGYKNHQQLVRFYINPNLIDAYLSAIYEESVKRGYSFDKTKFNKIKFQKTKSASVTKGQLIFEMNHLKNKLKKRYPEKLKEIENVNDIEPNPVFYVVKGGKEIWEKGALK